LRGGRFLRVAISLLLATNVVLAGLGMWAAGALAETPAQRLARLRAQADKVQATIDRMNDQTEALVERYNANQEALAVTTTRQRSTARQLDAGRAQLEAANQVLERRLRAIYINGPVFGLEQLLQMRSISDALTMTRYLQATTRADRTAVRQVESARAQRASIAAKLAAQHREQLRLRDQLTQQRDDIERRLAAQRSYLAHLDAAVRQAVEVERRRQEELRRQALARRLAAERAATARRAATAAPSSATQQAVAFARAQLGKPYQWGAAGPDAYDCSGLTMTSYRSAGVLLARTSAAQWGAGPHPASMADLQPGDLVFYAFDRSDPGTIHHVGLYAGDGLMIEAPHTGEVVRTASVNRPDYIGATRPTG
jgi:cell wall-associated NlpC family hydrolase